MEDQNVQQEWNPTLKFEIPLKDVEALLAVLSEAPLKFSLNAYMALRTEAERQIATLKAEAEQANEPEAGK
jgi:hypothetical protein